MNNDSFVKGTRSEFKIYIYIYIYIYIMDENDPLSEYKKIRLGHHRTNGAVYSKINFKVEICSALYIFDSHPRFISRDNTAQS